MKQRISSDQLNKLAPEQQGKLRSLWQPQQGDHFLILGEYEGIVKGCSRYDKIEDYVNPTRDDYIEYDEWKKSDCLPLLSIGQCIEIIKERKRSFVIDIFANSTSLYETHRDQENDISISTDKELINALWDAIKSIL